jgi:signal transduction histidine kinase
MLRALGEALGIGVAVAWRADHHDQRLRFVDLWAAPQVDVEAFREDSNHTEFEHGQGVLGDVWARGTPRAAEIARGGFRRQALLESMGFEGAVFVPIIQGGAVTGIVECFTSDLAHVDQALLDVIAEIGGQIGVAYDRAARMRQIEEGEERRRYVLGALLRAEEDAKAKLASDLHDDTIQVMVAALVGMDACQATIDRDDPGGALESMARARATLAEAVDRVRRMSFELRPPLLDAQGLGAAVTDLVDEVAAECALDSHIEVSVRRYAPEIEILAYRTVRELIANVRKHARAQRLELRMHEQSAALVCVLADDGVGFDAGRFDAPSGRRGMRLHLGLDATIERVRIAGGTFAIDSGTGGGTSVRFTVPIHRQGDVRSG